MRLGICFNKVTEPKEYEYAAKLGYEYLELQLKQVYELQKEELSNIISYTKTFGIKTECCNVFFKDGIRITGKDKKIDAAIEYAKVALSKANQLGIKIAVLGSAGARKMDEGTLYKDAKNEFAEVLLKLAPIAQENGIEIAIEPLGIKECNFINLMSEGLEIAQLVSHKCIGLTADYYHMYCNNEPVVILNECKNYLFHAHFADPIGRLLPVPENNESYMGFINELKLIGYNKRFSYEANDMENICKAIYLKKYL